MLANIQLYNEHCGSRQKYVGDLLIAFEGISFFFLLNTGDEEGEKEDIEIRASSMGWGGVHR